MADLTGPKDLTAPGTTTTLEAWLETESWECLACERERLAVAGAFEAAVKVCDEWAGHVWDSARDQAMAVKNRGIEIRALTPADAQAALDAHDKALVDRTWNDTREACARSADSLGDHFIAETIRGRLMPITDPLRRVEREEALQQARLKEAKLIHDRVHLGIQRPKCWLCDRIAELGGKP